MHIHMERVILPEPIEATVCGGVNQGKRREDVAYQSHAIR